MPYRLYDKSVYDNYIDYVMDKPKKEKTNQSPYMIVAPKPDKSVDSLNTIYSIKPKPTINDYVKSQQKMIDYGSYPRVTEKFDTRRSLNPMDGKSNPTSNYSPPKPVKNNRIKPEPISNDFIEFYSKKRKTDDGPYMTIPYKALGEEKGSEYVNIPPVQPKRDYYVDEYGNKISMRAEFDGNNLSVIRDVTSSMRDSTKSDTLKLKASAGENIGSWWSPKFDYSREKQKQVSKGPIPEGSYSFNPQIILKNVSGLPRFEDKVNIELYNTLSALAPKEWKLRGRWRGGHISWGRGRIDINPKKVNIDGVEREKFTAHGGLFPGSAGCIDLNKRDKKLFDYLEKYRGRIDSIPLNVNYKIKK